MTGRMIVCKIVDSLNRTESLYHGLRLSDVSGARINRRMRMKAGCAGALPRSGCVHTIVIPPSDSANLDAVVARTRGDQAVREAVSVFIDHAGTLIEQGGPMVLL